VKTWKDKSILWHLLFRQQAAFQNRKLVIVDFSAIQVKRFGTHAEYDKIKAL
jgi:mRNA-degrading endonuclease HigB of HigAB toxin-antitoxin module